MKGISGFFFILAIILTIAWGVIYNFVNALACGFSGPSGAQNCRLKMPWELDQESFNFLFVMPGIIILGVLMLAFLTRKPKQK